MAALEITGLEKRFGGVAALAGVDVSIDLDRIVGTERIDYINFVAAFAQAIQAVAKVRRFILREGATAEAKAAKRG